jgi:hypothetical protein
MSTQVTQDTLSVLNTQTQEYKRKYPLSKHVRLKVSTLRKLRERGSYGTSVNDIVVELLQKVERMEQGQI